MEHQCVGEIDVEGAARVRDSVAENASALPVMNSGQPRQREGGDVRIWMDGAFDMMHFGHMNAFRLGRSLGSSLIVGVNSSSSIAACKGTPIMSDGERCAMVAACRFVDEVVRDVPYVMNEAYVLQLIRERGIDYIVHGDDECIVDGKDVYEAAKRLGRFRTIPRTEGISTTDLLGRMLLHTKPSSLQHFGGSLFRSNRVFPAINRLHRMLASKVRVPEPTERVVYVTGDFDILHTGHLDLLAAARNRGDYLLVGVYSDAVIRRLKGPTFPVMNAQERALSVLGLRLVANAILDAPYEISDELLDSFHVSVVVAPHPTDKDPGAIQFDPYAAPRRRHILEFAPPASLTTSDLMARISERDENFVRVCATKSRKEDHYYAQRYGTPGNKC